MGLDMYLNAKAVVKSPEQQSKYLEIMKSLGLETFPVASPEATITAEVAYWRKANQIHGWFVNNCQGGVDECQETLVSREKLAELANLCQEILGAMDADDLGLAVMYAKKSFPPTSGSFFGSQDMDEGYFNGLKYTRNRINELLADKRYEGMEFYYQSSW